MTGIRENETMDKVALVFSISYVSMADQEFVWFVDRIFYSSRWP